MKKRLLAMLVLMLLVPRGAFAEDELTFGALSWETESGLSVFSDGGSGNADFVGFELSKGASVIKLPQIGADISDNICIKISGLADGAYTLRRFAAKSGEYFYSDAVYITADGGRYSVITYDEKQLLDAKSAAKSELTACIADKTVYREKELAVIDDILEKYCSLIDGCASSEDIPDVLNSAKAELDGVHKKEWFDNNALANKEVLSYLDDAYLWLCCKEPYGDIRFLAKERQIVNKIIPVIEEVTSEGSAGEIVITNEYIRARYAAEIAETKKIYKENMNDTERSWFNEKVAALKSETADFLKDFFG